MNQPITTIRTRFRPRRRHRKGLTIVVVLTLISITLALSYTILRSQMMSVQIQANSSRGDLAHQAAMTGLTIGIRKLHESGWAISNTVTGSVSSYESYSVTYATGDSALSTSSADYSDFPFRVTVTCVGTSVDPAHSTVSSTYKMSAVMRLIPRALSAQPAIWPTAQQFTVYQMQTDDFQIEVPARIEGPLRVQGNLRLGEAYNWSSSARSRFFSDLNAMRTSGFYADYRPFNSPISLPASSAEPATRSLLTSMGLTLKTISVTSRPTIPYPGTLTTYKLYTGGVSYNVPQMGATLQDVTLQADPASNPLGLFFCRATTTVKSNVTINGTLISGDDLIFAGSGVNVTSIELPNVSGGSGPVRLPAAVVADDLTISAAGAGALSGNVLVADNFLLDRGTASQKVQFVGRIIADQFQIRERSTWDQSSTVWGLYWFLFGDQLSNPPATRVGYFPVWLSAVGLNPIPLLTIKPDASPLTAHWQDLSQPLYVPASGDTGLRWDLLRWIDGA